VRLEIRLFAIARQRIGGSSIEIEVPDSATVADLRTALANTPLADILPSLMIAVDSEYAKDDQALTPASEVALIPPVSGGCDG
jgi:molybdopterin converting factor subunit 1